MLIKQRTSNQAKRLKASEEELKNLLVEPIDIKNMSLYDLKRAVEKYRPSILSIQIVSQILKGKVRKVSIDPDKTSYELLVQVVL